MQVTLSDSDIGKFIPNIILYEELQNKTPQQILNMLPLAILYQPHKEDPNMGHWTVLHKVHTSTNGEVIEFFDPYGFKPDGEFQVMSYKQPHYIAQLLLQLMNQEKVSYSPYNFQARTRGVNTCGRHIIVRNMFSKYDIDNYAKAIAQVSKQLRITPDQLVVILTS